VNTFHAVLLGIVQGLTEFLPISSTAHVTLAGKLFGLIDAGATESWTSFLAVVQVGTLAAVIAYFATDLLQMARSITGDLRKHGVTHHLTRYSLDTKLSICILVGTVPIGLAGMFFSEVLHGVLTKNLYVITGSLVTLAIFLWVAERAARHTRDLSTLSYKDAVLIGAAQALALIPGSSRSGTTITAALFLGLTRHAAARFSFLLSIPAVLASGLHELWSLTADPFQFGATNVIIATLCSALSGYAAIAWLLKFLMSRTTMVFVWYRLGLGILLVLLLIGGVIQP